MERGRFREAIRCLSQRLMKIQNPKSKLQRSSNNQAPTERTRGRRATFKYLLVPSEVSVLNDAPTSNGAPEPPFDLEERTAQFGEAIVRFSKKVPRDPTNNRLIDQLVGCGTSVGANYCEANERVPKRIFATPLVAVSKKQRRRDFFCAWSVHQNRNCWTTERHFIARRKSYT
jgi:hypothetical protein